MSEVRGRHRARYWVLFAALWLTLVALAVKVAIGWATRSLSLVAEALQTLITSFSLILSLIVVASPFTSERDVWGHGKLESILALLLVAFMGFTCFGLLAIAAQQLEVLSQMSPGEPLTQITPRLIQLLGVVTAITLCLGYYMRYQARLLESNVLRLSASHCLQDAWLMVGVLAGLVAVVQGYVWIDPLIAILMVFLGIGSVWQVLNRQLPSLLRQVAIAPESLARTIRQVEGILHCYGIQSRGMVGRVVYVELHLIVHPEFGNFGTAIADRVERLIRQQYGPAHVVVHIDRDRPLPHE